MRYHISRNSVLVYFEHENTEKSVIVSTEKLMTYCKQQQLVEYDTMISLDYLWIGKRMSINGIERLWCRDGLHDLCNLLDTKFDVLKPYFINLL